MATIAGARMPPVQRRYVPVRAKFAVALAAGLLWLMASIRLGQPWVDALGRETHPLFALFAISFIAYIPGFMNAFLVASLLLDRRPQRRRLVIHPGVTVLIAAYQEEAAIADTLKTIAAEGYPGPVEVLVLNDGSTDRTAQVAARAIGQLRFPANTEVRLVDFPVNRGKAAVLNDGLAQASHELVVTIDGDSRLNRDALTAIVERLMSDPDSTQAVAGAVLVRNSRRNLLTKAQEWDYFLGIAAVKRMQSLYQGTLVAQGAFSIYRKKALLEVGGWPHTVGEDIVLSWALLSRGYRIGYAEDAIVWTNAPTELKQFARQRQRWARGLIEALNEHQSLIFKPRLSQMFIWWNLLFLPLDLVYSLVFIPGILAALLFGIFWIAGPMTLAVLPFTAMWSLVMYRVQARMFVAQGLNVRRNFGGFLFYTLGYMFLLQPVSVWGYAVETAGLAKRWGTK
jgi:biofilm PGA synthesis N-glycosyltransferase PgaC